MQRGNEWPLALASERAGDGSRGDAAFARRAGSLERLAADAQEHGGEGARHAALRAANAALLEHLLHLVRALGRQPQALHDPEHVARDHHAHACELEALGPDLPAGHEGRVPGLATRVVVKRGVARVQHLEAHVLERGDHLLGLGHVREPVPLLDLLLDLAVRRVVGVVLVREAPLVAGEDRAGLEHPLDLRVDALAHGRVAGGLDGVDRVEAVVLEWGHVHKVTLD
mmetsp:Transcript_24329/g.71614  ORF Transcript_24329/g.71614 Transcript_24329/m.71614 type:complete len:227 (-) Transcript_24329:749-1429(-)